MVEDGIKSVRAVFNFQIGQVYYNGWKVIDSTKRDGLYIAAPRFRLPDSEKFGPTVVFPREVKIELDSLVLDYFGGLTGGKK